MVGADPVGEAEQPGAAVGLGPAAAVVDDRDDQRAVLPGECQRYLRGVGVLDGVRDGLAGDEVRRRLDVAREPLRQRGDVEPDRRAGRELAQRRAESLVERSGPESARQLAQLVDRRGRARRPPRRSPSPAPGRPGAVRAGAPVRWRPTAAGRRRGGRGRSVVAPRRPPTGCAASMPRPRAGVAAAGPGAPRSRSPARRRRRRRPPVARRRRDGGARPWLRRRWTCAASGGRRRPSRWP